jgi:L-serine dehydratase
MSPDTIDSAAVEPTLQRIRTGGRLRLLGRHEIAFDEPLNLLFHTDQVLPGHSNGMRFSAHDAAQQLLAREEYYSIGGGFVVQAGAPTGAGTVRREPPHDFNSAARLLEHGRALGLEIHELMLARERTWAGEAEVRARLLRIWQVMQDCVRRGFEASGLLPGVLGVRRRAPKLYRQLMSGDPASPMHALDWVNVYALAVNEENAAGGQVVTAPTNGAAGIVPAVLHYYRRFEPGADDDGVIRFLLTAAAIGMLYKQNASISGAEMGCQGEVGVACSMAAAGLTAAVGGTITQVENAAEVGMEHHLGMTCDPVGGLVQIPCIERNAFGAIKAINAASLSLHGDGTHRVSLDQVIATMRQTGHDMQSKYKETSLGGLAVNFTEC